MKHLLNAFPQALLSLFAAWTLFTGASAQTPIPVSLLRPSGNQPQRDFVVYNGWLYFASASDEPSGSGPDGRELYRADGSVTNTSRVRNINTATGQGSDPASFVEYNGKLYFAATNTANGRELWVTDGTFSGTQLVKDLNAGTASGSPFGLCMLNGKLYFTAFRTGGAVKDLWESDGTEAGTRLLSDAIGTSTGTDVNEILVAGGQLFYSVSNRHLWATDGTAGGTRLVKGGPANSANPNGSPFFAGIGSFVDFNGRLIFRGNAIGQGEDETWISDGTSAGTYPLEANLGPNGSFPSGHTVYNGKVYFNTNEPPGSWGLWVTDGTQAGTQSVRPGASASELRVSQGRLWFSLNGEPWTIDGSGAVARVKDISPGTGASRPAGFTAFDGETYFTADDGTTGRELWASDGTEAGTQRVSNLGEVAPTMAVVGTRLFFSAKSDFSGSTFELYRLLASDTPAPVSPAIADRTGIVGVSFFHTLSAFTGPSYLFPLSYSAAGLPPGITFSGGAGGIVTGNPTTAGVYSVTVSATGIGGFPTGRAFYTITINSAGGGVGSGGQLQLLAPTYNCVSGALTLNPSGGDGSPVEYRVAGLRDWVASPDFTVPPWQLTGVTFTLEARQNGTVSSRPFTASCEPVSGGGSPLQLLAPTYNCASGALVFNASGGDGSPIEFAAAGVRDWSTDPNSVIELGIRLDPNSQPLTLMARQSGTVVTYSFDFRAVCGGARQAAGEPDSGFRVRVLGNPQANETVDVVIDGAAGESMRLTVQDTRGRVVSEQTIERASSLETRTVGLGKTAGMVLLRIKTARHSQTVKIIRQ